MVGVPALWQLLERRILQQVDARGPLARAAFDAAAEVNRWLAANVGIDAGRVLFGAVHDKLGGHVKWLISGGAALPRETQERFAGLGLPLTEGYGLTEAAPVLTVSRPGKRVEPGVGKPVPGVELRIANPDDRGIGEVVARGPNVMVGYTDDDATRAHDRRRGLAAHRRPRDASTARGGSRSSAASRTSSSRRRARTSTPTTSRSASATSPGVAELAVVGVERARQRAARVPRGARRDDRGRERATALAHGRIDELPFGQRPAIVHLYDAPCRGRRPARSSARRCARSCSG